MITKKTKKKNENFLYLIPQSIQVMKIIKKTSIVLDDVNGEIKKISKKSKKDVEMFMKKHKTFIKDIESLIISASLKIGKQAEILGVNYKSLNLYKKINQKLDNVLDYIGLERKKKPLNKKWKISINI